MTAKARWSRAFAHSTCAPADEQLDSRFAKNRGFYAAKSARKLGDSNGNHRCVAVDLMLRLEGAHGIPYVLPLFDDPEEYFRWHVIGAIQKGARP